jgi:dihydrofolate synthase/folylpolyglutamate synthase
LASLEDLAAHLAGSGERFTVILGLLGPKQPEVVLAPLRPHARRFLFVRPRSPRAIDPVDLLAPAADVPAELCSDLSSALVRARELDGPILIAGSLYLVGEARALLLGEPCDPVPTADPLGAAR